MQYTVIEPYFIYRRQTDKKLFIRRIDTEGKQNYKPEFTLDLEKSFISKSDINCVCFFAVPRNAFQSLRFNKGNGKLKLHPKNLLQIVVKQKINIYRLESDKKTGKLTAIKEVNYFDNFK